MKPEGGTYALILVCPSKKRVQIGKLGSLEMRRGFYVYVGSALGPGGLRARVAHHQKVSQRPHWHIITCGPTPGSTGFGLLTAGPVASIDGLA